MDLRNAATRQTAKLGAGRGERREKKREREKKGPKCRGFSSCYDGWAGYLLSPITTIVSLNDLQGAFLALHV
jgi:hypothetical protein